MERDSEMTVCGVSVGLCWSVVWVACVVAASDETPLATGKRDT